MSIYVAVITPRDTCTYSRSLREAPLSETATIAHENSATKTSGVGLVIAAVGVVYGDIGTSPLYTLKEVFSGHFGVQANHDGVLGILSLIFWSLVWVVSIKYVLFILRADNQGEGGIMALTALARCASSPYPNMSKVLVLLGLFGAALFYGDSMITPAISVLSAVEGWADAIAPPWRRGGVGRSQSRRRLLHDRTRYVADF